MHTPIILQTERLILRQWSFNDLDALAELNSDPRVMEHFPSCATRAESEVLFKNFQRHFAEYPFGAWALQLKDNPLCIGFVGLMHLPFGLPFEAHFTPAVEIGWRLAHAHWGKGYIPEAAATVIQAAWEQFALEEIVAFTVPSNSRSQRVMQKIGMHYDPVDDFAHPCLPKDHPLSHHVLYRIKKNDEAMV